MQNKQGSANNPIAIEEEQQITNDRSLILDEARNKIIIQEAELSQPLDMCFAVCKTNIPGDLSTKKRLLNKAIIRYFKKQIDINISCEHFQPRIEPDYSDPETIPNPSEILLYGVDFLTTNLIKDRFTTLQTKIREIVWINDSTCKLIYGSAVETQQFIKEQVNEAKMEEDSQAILRGWFSIDSYEIFSFKRLLWARYATSAQKTMEKSVKKFYQKFAIAKLQLGKHLLENFNAISKYTILVEELQKKKYLQRRRQRSPERDHSASRTRQKYRNNSRFRRQFQDNPRQSNNYRNRYGQNRYQMEEVHQVRYAHRPVNMNDSYVYNNNPRNRDYNDRDRDQNTSFNNQPKKYLDFHQKKQNLNTSFNYNSNPNHYNRNLNLSFRQQQRGPKKYYDAAQIDSEYSFNQFGSIRKENNEREDFHCDFNQEEKRSLVGGRQEGVSFTYDRQDQKNKDFNTQFQFEQRPSNRNDANISFNFDNGPGGNKNKNADQSFVINSNKNDGSKPRQDEQDFFERLNSNISSVRQINQQDFNDNNSFEYDKNVDSKNKKPNNILSQSFYNQDSY